MRERTVPYIQVDHITSVFYELLQVGTCQPNAK